MTAITRSISWTPKTALERQLTVITWTNKVILVYPHQLHWAGVWWSPLFNQNALENAIWKIASVLLRPHCGHAWMSSMQQTTAPFPHCDHTWMSSMQQTTAPFPHCGHTWMSSRLLLPSLTVTIPGWAACSRLLLPSLTVTIPGWAACSRLLLPSLTVAIPGWAADYCSLPSLWPYLDEQHTTAPFPHCNHTWMSSILLLPSLSGHTWMSSRLLLPSLTVTIPGWAAYSRLLLPSLTVAIPGWAAYSRLLLPSLIVAIPGWAADYCSLPSLWSYLDEQHAGRLLLPPLTVVIPEWAAYIRLLVSSLTVTIPGWAADYCSLPSLWPYLDEQHISDYCSLPSLRPYLDEQHTTTPFPHCGHTWMSSRLLLPSLTVAIPGWAACSRQRPPSLQPCAAQTARQSQCRLSARTSWLRQRYCRIPLGQTDGHGSHWKK